MEKIENNMTIELNPNISIITLSINDINTPNLKAEIVLLGKNQKNNHKLPIRNPFKI